MFRAADIMLLNKCDLLPYLEFDADLAEANARRVNPDLTIFRVSATSGEGLAAWVSWIETGLEAQRGKRIGNGRYAEAACCRTGTPVGRRVVSMAGRQIRVRGLVQGVGFRPYVWRLANELGLRGWVRNDGAGVTIAVDGPKTPEFLSRLPNEAPRLARIDNIEAVAAEVDGEGFAIFEQLGR